MTQQSPSLRTLVQLAGLLATVAAYPPQQQTLVGVDHGSPFTKEFEEFTLWTLNKWHVPGVSVAVVDGDDIYTEGFGFAALPDMPATSETLYMAGSTTKAFTAAALGLLIASGNFSTPPLPGAPSSAPEPLRWTTPISAVLPEDFVMSDPWATAHLTLEDAASHRTGLPRHDKALARFYGAGAGRHPATLTDVVRQLRYLPLASEPRTRWQYCNLMWAVLSHAVETLLGGRWLGDVLRERIWTPLDMHGTYFSLEDALAAPEHLAAGYYWDEAASAPGFREIPPMSLWEVSGAGSVVTSVRDYALWAKSWIDGTGPLPKDVQAALWEPKMIVRSDSAPFDAPPLYASGWQVASFKGHRLYTHSGGMEAYGAEIYIFPDLKYGVVTLANTAVTSNAVGDILVWKLVYEKLGIPEASNYSWEKRWENIVKTNEDRARHAVDRLFPDRPEKPLPPALPLSKYTGTYYNAGYQNVTLLLPNDAPRRKRTELIADHTDFTWQLKLEFEHVTGEHWIMYGDMAKSPGTGAMKEYAAVQFKVGASGHVSQVGIQWQESSAELVDGWIWYDRIE